MINADIDEPMIVHQVIDPIGDGLAICYRKKVIDIDFGGFPCGLPLGPVVLELAEQLLLLAVHRNDRVALLLKHLACGMDVLKLRIAVGMRGPFNVFLIRSQRVPTRA